MNTCEGLCPIAKRLKVKNITECPNYLQNIFMDNKGEKIIVNDCAPKRTMLMIQELSNRMVGTQKVFEQQRNRSDIILHMIGESIKARGIDPLTPQDDDVIDVEGEVIEG